MFVDYAVVGYFIRLGDIKFRFFEQGKLLIVFEDTGPGISLENIETIFEPLFSTKTFGVCLGMPVVKQVLEQHKGGVQIESEPGSSTRVTLWLPCEGG